MGSGVEVQMPVAGVDCPATFAQLRSWFSDDEACAAYLARLRWPDGFRCPRCACPDAWQTASGLWLCRSCRRKTSVTAGTIFHRSRLPLTDWFAAVWFVTSQKDGVSALGLQRVLGMGSYRTAWTWMHKLRRAMVRPTATGSTGWSRWTRPWSGAVSGANAPPDGAPPTRWSSSSPSRC